MSDGVTNNHHDIHPARGREAVMSGDMTYEELSAYACALLDTLEVIARAVLILHGPMPGIATPPQPRRGDNDDG
jgi:hypothetical protein